MFIAKEFSLPQERGSCCEVMSAPLVENVQRPWARPRSLALEKRSPNAAHSLRAQVRRERWRDVSKTCFHPRAQRTAQPFFPRQSKRFFPLGKNFFGQQPSQSFHQ